METAMPERSDIPSWLHIGDPHITDARLENHCDLPRIVALAQALPPGGVDFAVLPGDKAARSTGQIEEGARGLSPVAVDRCWVSWRAKTVDDAWPEKGIQDTRLGPNRNGRKW
jgi:hypothetical protein